MKTLRPALLVLLTSSLAGLGVPASFGQAKATPKSSAKNQGANTASTPRAAAAGSKKAPSKTSGKASAKTSGKPSKKSRKQPGQKTPTNDRISEIQIALAKDGSFQGTPTGKWDDDTSTAMRRFQASHGLKPNGKLDAPTLQKLGLGSQTAGIAPPTPPPGATSRLTSSAISPSSSPDSSPRE
jgi:peptidoglycan hydrolase-like protein with peptidoglycan-binding domain